jgi:hypothetical protein
MDLHFPNPSRSYDPTRRAVQFWGYDHSMEVSFFVAEEALRQGAVAEVVGIEGGVVSGVMNLESSGVGAPDGRPRHDEPYHEAGCRSA